MKQIKKCVIPAAGMWTRFLPATKALPKEMFPIIDKPVMQMLVEEAISAGCTDIIIVTWRSKRAIEDHFDRSYEIEKQINGTSKEKLMDGIRDIIKTCTYSYTRQVEMKGLCHAILTGETLIGNEQYAVLLEDDLCDNHEEDSVLTQMIKIYEEYKCSIVAVEEIPMQDTNKYGVIAGETIGESLVRVNNMVEKPDPKDAPSNLAIIGRYILTPDIFDILENVEKGVGGEIQLTDALKVLSKEQAMYAYTFEGKRYDVGNKLGFLQATVEFALKRDYLKDDFKEYLVNLLKDDICVNEQVAVTTNK